MIEVILSTEDLVFIKQTRLFSQKTTNYDE